MGNSTTNNNQKIISTAKDVATYLGKSESWVYKYQKKLGVKKLGGSLLFPNREELYEFILCKEKGVEIRFHPKRQKVHRSVVQNKDRSKTSGSKKKKGTRKSRSNDAVKSDPNRYGLLDAV